MLAKKLYPLVVLGGLLSLLAVRAGCFEEGGELTVRLDTVANAPGPDCGSNVYLASVSIQ